MLSWWRNWEYRNRLAQVDATVLIARYGVRASHIANRRMAMMGSDPIHIVLPVTGSVFIPLHVDYCPMMETMETMERWSPDKGRSGNISKLGRS
jgi:hypothetical protein